MKPTFLGVLVIALIAGCGGSASTVEPTSGPTPTRAAAALLAPTAEIVPITFPGDEAPHDMLTEWWYYTGHLLTSTGDRYGFEFVVFQGKRTGLPTGYAAHFAITDPQRQTFTFAQRVSAEQQAGSEKGFSLSLGDWHMDGVSGVDHLVAGMDGYAIDLETTSISPPVLHNEIGYISYGDLGGSYYYSRTRMAVAGALQIDGTWVTVSGDAWMDHQWGNFIPLADGGWDWFSVQLDDGHDLMVYVIRDATGAALTSYGTVVDSSGSTTPLAAADFSVHQTGTWTSDATGAVYPSGWTIDVRSLSASLNLSPTILNQELDTRTSTGVIYWEGEVTITGTLSGKPVAGLGYVELTGYSTR